MKYQYLIPVVTLLAACAPTMYWNKAGVNEQGVAKALHACRMDGSKANQGGNIIYSGWQLESTCMTAKGYELSPTPPQK